MRIPEPRSGTGVLADEPTARIVPSPSMSSAAVGVAVLIPKLPFFKIVRALDLDEGDPFVPSPPLPISKSGSVATQFAGSLTPVLSTLNEPNTVSL